MEKKETYRVNMLIVLTFILLNFVFPLQKVHAEESELNFYIQPILPESQLETGASNYFDLNLAPGKTDVLQLEVVNSSNKEIIVETTVHTAFTNVNGIVEYGKDAEQPDATLPASVDSVLKAPGEVRLEANEKRIIEIPVHMPEEKFEGVLAGGIRMEEVRTPSESESENDGVAITNAFSYVIGVVISNNRTSQDPDLELLDVFADQLNYRNVFSATIQNFASTFVNKLTVEATIREVGSSEVLYEANQSDMQMAPNSHFNFPISLEGDRFRSGSYILNLMAQSENDEWSWEMEFTVDTERARALNRSDVTIDTSINWWMISSIVAIILLMSVVVGLIVKKKRELAAIENGD